MSNCTRAPRCSTIIVSPETTNRGCIDAVAREQQGLGADDRVHADFGQQAREHGGDRGRCGRIGVRQPEGQRENRSFNAESDQQHQVQDLLEIRVEVTDL